MSGEAVAPEGIGSVRLRIEDDLNDIHTIHLHDIQYLPEGPMNIFIPQVFSQQHQSEGDSKASCSISADAISLQWTGENGNIANKYVPLNKSNVGICFTASRYKQFRAFAALLIQFPPEMDENWVRYGLAKLGQISELPNWQRMLFCAYTTQLLHSTGEVCWNNNDSYFIWFEFVCINSGQIASRRSWKRSCLGLEYTSKCSRLALLWEPN